MTDDSSRLKRPLQPMPQDIAERLEADGLRQKFDSRPAYQRNDYLGWIARAKRVETREKRIAQMLRELGEGTRYMNMAWRAAERQT
ncbi:YdeI/OmpD-associated family protein [Devosia sp.]|uniref:YdeI/OmpD-associated family protein n=1 Tax=Devosia sp. TaxID=1871048 RepID=UPI003A92ECF9